MAHVLIVKMLRILLLRMAIATATMTSIIVVRGNPADYDNNKHMISINDCKKEIPARAMTSQQR